jgi:hypothetical protein
MARPRKKNVIRDAAGKSRGEPMGIHPETLAVRERQLVALRIPLQFTRMEMGRSITKRTAEDRLSGFTLGVLRLRPQGDPGAISEAQFDAGDTFCKIVHRHAAVMGYRLSVPSPGFVMQSRGSSSVVEDDVCLLEHKHTEECHPVVRRKFRACFDALMEETRKHGKRIWQVTYGVCVENWPPGALSMADYGHLRTGLNALGRAI